MKIRYKKSIGIISIVLGVLFGCLYFVLALFGESTVILTTLGFLGILFGVLLLSRPYFELNQNSLVLFAILGPAKTIYPIQSHQDIKVENNKVSILKDGQSQPISISAWMVDKNDWQAFLKKVEPNGTPE